MYKLPSEFDLRSNLSYLYRVISMFFEKINRNYMPTSLDSNLIDLLQKCITSNQGLLGRLELNLDYAGCL